VAYPEPTKAFLKRSAKLPVLTLYPVGRGLTLELIRRNQQCDVSEAMAPVDVNLQYDFDYQQFTYLPNEVRVLPVSNHIISCYIQSYLE